MSSPTVQTNHKIQSNSKIATYQNIKSFLSFALVHYSIPRHKNLNIFFLTAPVVLYLSFFK